MKKKHVYVIGLMSGTSLDGLDIVYCRFSKNEYSNFEIIFSETIEYTVEWKKNLKEAIAFSKKAIDRLNINYGFFLGEKINEFIKKHRIQNIDFISSHGHTIFHKPEEGITLQIGDGQEIANVTNQKTVCDFRTQDVELGGQGAPLVPIGDELLFSEYDYCLNLGGFANVSYKKEGKRIAFDICPVNIVLNHYVKKLGFAYDDGGEIASTGVVNNHLLNALNVLPFYKEKHPKSLGLEWVNNVVLPLIDDFQLQIPDVLKTFVEHIATQLAVVGCS